MWGWCPWEVRQNVTSVPEKGKTILISSSSGHEEARRKGVAARKAITLTVVGEFIKKSPATLVTATTGGGERRNFKPAKGNR